MSKAFGRILNTDTMMYEVDDGSGISLPFELVEQIKCDMVSPYGGVITGLTRKWNYEREQTRNHD